MSAVDSVATNTPLGIPQAIIDRVMRKIPPQTALKKPQKTVFDGIEYDSLTEAAKAIIKKYKIKYVSIDSVRHCLKTHGVEYAIEVYGKNKKNTDNHYLGFKKTVYKGFEYSSRKYAYQQAADDVGVSWETMRKYAQQIGGVDSAVKYILNNRRLKDERTK